MCTKSDEHNCRIDWRWSFSFSHILTFLHRANSHYQYKYNYIFEQTHGKSTFSLFIQLSLLLFFVVLQSTHNFNLFYSLVELYNVSIFWCTWKSVCLTFVMKGSSEEQSYKSESILSSWPLLRFKWRRGFSAADKQRLTGYQIQDRQWDRSEKKSNCAIGIDVYLNDQIRVRLQSSVFFFCPEHRGFQFISVFAQFYPNFDCFDLIFFFFFSIHKFSFFLKKGERV